MLSFVLSLLTGADVLFSGAGWIGDISTKPRQFELPETKNMLRMRLKQLRQARVAKERLPGFRGGWNRFQRVRAERRLQWHLYRQLAHQQPSAIAAFIPLAGEIDVSSLMHKLHDRGWRILLPSIEGQAEFLKFRRWYPGTELVQGKYDIWHPPETAPAEWPDALIVPLLGFDRFGQRVGQGAGWYDRTFAAMHSHGRKPLKIGVAYEEQLVAHIPHESHDVALDAIATPSGLIDCRAYTRI